MTIRRSAGLSIMLLSVFGFLLCVAGAAGVWKGKSRFDALAAALFGTGDEAFVFLESRLERAKQTIDKGRGRVSGLSALAQRLKNTETDVSAEFVSLRATVDEMYAGLQSAEHWLDSSEAVARGVNRVSQALAASQAAAAEDGREPTAVTAQRVAEFSVNVTEAIVRLQIIRQELLELRDTGTLAREAAARIITRVAELDAKLANVSARIDAFNAHVSKARASSLALEGRVHWWVAIAAVMLTLVLLWFGVSQLAMLKSGWRFARRPVAPS